MGVPFWPSPVQISALLRVIPAKRIATIHRHDMPPESSDCKWKRLVDRRLTNVYSTDQAILAVNGFAADGNMFIKKVRQRLEVCLSRSYFTLSSSDVSSSGIDVHIQKICRYKLSLISSTLCSMPVDSFRTMCSFSSEESRKMVRLMAISPHHKNLFDD